MPKYKKKFHFGSREVEFDVNNKLPDTFSELAIRACLQLVEIYPPFNFPKLKINLVSEFKGNVFEKHTISELKNLPIPVSLGGIDPGKKLPEIKLCIDILAIGVITNNQLSEQEIGYFITGRLNQHCINLFIEQLNKTMMHEGTHLWHKNQSEFLKLRKKARIKAERSLKKYTILKEATKQNIARFLRIKKNEQFTEILEKRWLEVWKDVYLMLRNFIELTFIEGIAMYMENMQQYKFEPERMKKNYEEALEVIFNFRKKLYNILQQQKLQVQEERNLMRSRTPDEIEEFRLIFEELTQEMEWMENVSYSVGAHMVYFILYSHQNPLFIEEISKMNVPTFIDEYIKSCRQLGFAPLISLRGGEGVFDYGRALIYWRRSAEFIKRKK
ncbi:MAG: hypothetical protein V1831_02890 [Candidatus Woesearchaeota archaeon]